MTTAQQSPFTVRQVGTAEENGVFTVAIAEEPVGGDGRGLLFSCVVSDDWDIVDENDETYCVVDETQMTVYGCLQSCVLQSDRLTLQWDPQAAEQFALPETSVFPLEIDEAAIATLREGLQRVLSSAKWGVPDPLVL